MRADVLAFDFICELNAYKSSDGIDDAFQRFVGTFGFTDFLVGRLTPDPAKNDRGEIWAASCRHDWFEPWFKKNYRRDPGAERARTLHAPFRWTDMRPVYEACGLPILDEVREFGLSDGLTSSFRLRDGTVFGITLGTPDYDLDQTARTSILLASAYCGTKLADFRHWPAREPTALSLRERECICWVATGKTDWEISEILGISQQTVHKHVSNALKKLGAGTRAHAVAIALASRLIAL